MIRPGQYPSVDEHERQVAKQQEAAVSSDRSSRREVLAFIALQDLPMPTVVHLYDNGIWSMRLDSVADGQEWSRHLGGRTDTYVSKSDGSTYLNEGVIRWRGWSVQLLASDDRAPDTELDEDTASALREIAGGDQ